MLYPTILGIYYVELMNSDTYDFKLYFKEYMYMTRTDWSDGKDL